jgi:hypothetical protein
MLRRDALRLLASTAAVPVLRGLHQSQLLALGRRIHVEARDDGGPVVRALDVHQEATVAVAADRIIPATDTPGASDAHVASFIDTMLARWYPSEDRERFLAGLAELDARAWSAHGRDFIECTPLIQTELLTSLDDEVAALRRTAAIEAAGQPQGSATSSAADRHWFAVLKHLTIWGYCTSEPFQAGVLGHYPMPGRFDGCAHV